jgi:O-antigen/teichoic acid export membrane protein
VSGGPALIRFLYDERATAAGPIVQVLSVGAWFLALEMSNGSALLAQGKPKWVAASSAAKLAGMAVFIPLGYTLGGFAGAIAGFAGSELLRYAVSLWGATRSKLGGHRQDAASVSRAAQWAMGDGRSGRGPALCEGAAIFVAVTAVWAVVLRAHRRNSASRPAR